MKCMFWPKQRQIVTYSTKFLCCMYLYFPQMEVWGFFHAELFKISSSHGFEKPQRNSYWRCLGRNTQYITSPHSTILPCLLCSLDQGWVPDQLENWNLNAEKLSYLWVMNLQGCIEWPYDKAIIWGKWFWAEECCWASREIWMAKRNKRVAETERQRQDV